MRYNRKVTAWSHVGSVPLRLKLSAGVSEMEKHISCPAMSGLT